MTEDRMILRPTLPWMRLLTFVFLTIHAAQSTSVAADPPENIKIIDPGRLGYLNIEWSPPSSLHDLRNCTLYYQLRFYDTYTGRWEGVRTTRLFYAAQFNLEEPIQVRMLTLLKGACTNGTDILGDEVELVHVPEHNGVAGSRIREFNCVYFNKEYMECTWEPGTAEPADSEHYLYYWHREMQETKECPEYVPSSKHRKGCRFPPTSLLEFSEFNICVNGSSQAGGLEPTFLSLAVQNHVKPAQVSNLHMVYKDNLVHVEWAPPPGPIPVQCLEYELEITTVSHNGSEKQTTTTEEGLFYFHRGDETKKNCVQVRSKINIYCADDGFWSDWSQPRCIPDLKPVRASWSPLLLIGIIASVVVLLSTVCFMLWMLRKMWKNRNEQKHVFRALYQDKVQKAIHPIFSPMF